MVVLPKEFASSFTWETKFGYNLNSSFKTNKDLNTENRYIDIVQVKEFGLSWMED